MASQVVDIAHADQRVATTLQQVAQYPIAAGTTLRGPGGLGIANATADLCELPGKARWELVDIRVGGRCRVDNTGRRLGDDAIATYTHGIACGESHVALRSVNDVEHATGSAPGRI